MYRTHQLVTFTFDFSGLKDDLRIRSSTRRREYLPAQTSFYGVPDAVDREIALEYRGLG